jgi:hypothetical protein
MPSSVVQSFTYDAGHRRLRIVYISGNVYDYLQVPASIYRAMKEAGSKGTFLNTRIKGRYEFERVR